MKKGIPGGGDSVESVMSIMFALKSSLRCSTCSFLTLILFSSMLCHGFSCKHCSKVKSLILFKIYISSLLFASKSNNLSSTQFLSMEIKFIFMHFHC